MPFTRRRGGSQMMMRGLVLLAPALTSPADAASVNDPTPDLDWEAVANTENYRVQVALTSDFASPLVNTTVADPTTVYTVVYELLNHGSGPFYWRVRAEAVSGAVVSDWSEVRDFSLTVDALIARLVTAGASAIWDAGKGVYSDAGTTPATNGGTVVQFNDQSGNGYHLTAESAPTDRRPLWQASIAGLNNRPAIQYDDTNDYFVRAVAGGIANAAGNTYNIIAVWLTDNSGSLDYAYTEGGSSTTPSLRLGKSSDAVIGVHRSDASVLVAPSGGSGAGNNAMHVAGFRRLASNDFRLMLDNTEVANASSAPGTTTITHVCLGAFWQTSPTNAANQWGDYLAHTSIYPSDVYATIRPILDAWYRPA